jgi:hypothetical protein
LLSLDIYAEAGDKCAGRQGNKLEGISLKHFKLKYINGIEYQQAHY